MTCKRVDPCWFNPDTLESLPWSPKDDEEAFENDGWEFSPTHYSFNCSEDTPEEFDAFREANPPIEDNTIA